MTASGKIQKGVKVITCSTIALAATAFGTSQALAQAQSPATRTAAADADRSTTPESSASNEIVVTAQKRTERLIDTPLSVSVLSAENLIASGASQFRDFAASVPGLSYRSSGPAMNQISLRGVSVGADVSSTVGVYVDDVPYGSSTSFTKAGIISLDSSLFDLDRVEILKGPQGTLYGASTMGGLIKYVTSRPDETRFEGKVRAGVSTTHHGGVGYNGGVMVNLPLGEDKAALRASAFQTHEGGYVDNITLGRDNVGASDVYGGRLDLLLKPTDRLSVRLNGFLQNVRANGFPLADYKRDRTPVAGALDQQRNIRESFDMDFRVASATIGYDLDWATLTSVSSYQTSQSHIAGDYSSVLLGTARSLVSPTIASAALDDHQRTKKFVQEVRLVSQGSSSIDWALGGFYTHESSRNNQAFVFRNASGAIVPNTLFTFYVPSVYQEYAVFGDVTWRITEHFDVTAGLRYAHNDQRFQQIGTGTIGASAPRTSFSGDVFTYLANARYKFSDHATAYVRYATGYRPGGPNFIVLSSTTGQPLGLPSFSPDKLKSYEIGFKGETRDRRLGLELAAFQIDWDNIQVTVTQGPFGNRANVAEGARIRGAELVLTARPLNGLSATGAASYQDPEFKKAVPLLGILAAKGERLSGVPKVKINLGLDYAPPGVAGAPSFGASLNYQGNATNGYGALAYRVPPFTTLDLRAGISLGQVRLQAFARNVTDTRGQVVPRLILYPAANGPFQISIIQPRTFGLQLSAEF